MSNKALPLLAAAAIAAATLVSAGTAGASRAEAPTLLEFGSMAANPRPYTGVAGAIRGINAGGAPWAITNGHGELKKSGRLEIAVTGLVLDPADPALQAAGVAGTVPAAVQAGGLRAVVSCLSKDAAGAATTVNVSTPAVRVDAAGNAMIEARVTLPSPCLAPIVFVTSAGGAWFATTGG